MKLIRWMLLMCLLTSGAWAQNYTTVIATNITTSSGAKLRTGKLCFTATDGSDTTINYQVGGGGQVIIKPVCTPVSNGGIGVFAIANSDNTIPIGVLFRIEVLDPTGVVLTYKLTVIHGASFNLDTYIPPVGPISSGISVPSLTVGVLSVTSCIGNGCGHTIQSNGVSLAGETKLNFLGGVTCVDNPGVSTDCTGASSPVQSIFTRTGNVTAQSGDYTVGQITGAEASANKNQANGYAGLDGSTLLLAAQHGTGTTNSTTVLFGDRAWRQPAFSNLSGSATNVQLPADVAYIDVANLFSTTQTLDTLGTATSGANFNSNIAQWRSSFWNGSAATPDIWSGQSVLGSGTNPASIWTFSHTGTTGNAQVRFAAQKSLAVIADQTVSPICAEGLRASDSATMWSICYSSGNAVTFTSSGGSLQFTVNGSNRWLINASGHILANTDDVLDLGATGANRPRSIYAATDINLESVANGARWKYGYATELLTLSTSGTTTDTVGNLLPTDSIIEAVEVRVTTTITTATNWSVGDATTPARFCTANSTLVSGTTATCTIHVDQTGAAGPRQTAAAKVRITTTGTPGAGAIRITVFYRVFTPPTS